MKNKDSLDTKFYLYFEKPILDYDQQIIELEEDGEKRGIKYLPDIRKIRRKKAIRLRKIYSDLDGWQVVQIARHFKRPIFQDYIDKTGLIKDFRELHGDRCFGDDRIIITGFGKIGNVKLMIIGQNKGRKTKEKIECNFGCANPEGYRKALLKMKLAEKYRVPVVSFIDTPGAYPGIEAEERGQASAIGMNLREMSRLKVPIISIVIGEGGSGGALAIGVGDRFAMLANSFYSVISPEGCAAILEGNLTKAPEYAKVLGLTSKKLLSLGLIDDIIKEPLGGAHRHHQRTFHNVQEYIVRTLNELNGKSLEDLLDERYKRLISFGTDSIKQKTKKRLH